MMVVFSKLYPACQIHVDGFKPGINLNNAEKRVARSSTAEFLGIK